MEKSSEDNKIISEMTRMFERLDQEEAKGSNCPLCGSLATIEDRYCSTCGQELRKPERPKVIVRRITVT